MTERFTSPGFGALRAGAWVLLAAAAACDLPTEAPQWDTQWLVPVDSARISVQELLPSNVGVSPDGSAFEITMSPANFSQDLATLCPLCPLGGVFPKVAFQTSFSDMTTLPNDVVGATTRSATASVVFTNNMSFDPVRPGGSETGEIRITVRDGSLTGPVLAERVIDGATEAVPPGLDFQFQFDLGNQSFGDTLITVVTIDSPLGPPVLLSAGDNYAVSFAPDGILLDEAVIRLDGQSVDIDPVTLDAEQVPADIIEHIEGGALVLEVANPFQVEANMQLQISGPGFLTIQKDLAVGMGASEETVTLTQAELRSFLGQADVSFSGTGAASAPSGSTAVRADQVVLFNAFLELTVRVGSQP